MYGHTFIFNCDWIYKNQPNCHILYFEKYHFEILKQPWFSCATLQPHQIYYTSRAALQLVLYMFVANSATHELVFTSSFLGSFFTIPVIS